MSRRILGAAVICLGLSTAALAADKAPKAGGKPKEVVSVAKTAKVGDKDPNIKNADAKNDKANVPDAPPEKGGKARGAGPWGCSIVFDNWTGYVVKAFVDGDFVGTVGRFGDGRIRVGNGATLMYARADFFDGTALTWGPEAVDCPAGGSFHWKMQ